MELEKVENTFDYGKVESMLEKISVRTTCDEGEPRMTPDVLCDLSNVWGALNQEFKDELMEAMGLAK